MTVVPAPLSQLVTQTWVPSEEIIRGSGPTGTVPRTVPFEGSMMTTWEFTRSVAQTWVPSEQTP